jgi:hypothetical protein
MPSLDREISEAIARLSPGQQRRVLEFARSLDEPRRGVPGATLLRFAGTLSAEDAREIAAAIEDGCERIPGDP